MGFDGCLTQAAQFPAKTLVQFKKQKATGVHLFLGTSYYPEPSYTYFWREIYQPWFP
jgi:hypothetical protein